MHFQTRPDGKAREIVGVPRLLADQFSKRTHQIDPKTEALAEEFRPGTPRTGWSSAPIRRGPGRGADVGAMLESICAAPGTGKSFLLGAIADAWQGSGQQMFGLATTEELAARGLDLANPPDATTAEDWLESHRAQQATMEAARVGAGRYNA